MPFKFWKKEETKPAPPPPKREARPAEATPAKTSAKAPAKPAPPPAPKRTPEDIAVEIHKGLVEAGLTIDGTREVFKKRITEKFGSFSDFEREMTADPQATVTAFVTSWLGFTVPAKFSLKDLLYSANQRLSSFGIQVNTSDESSVDDARGLREATLTLGDQTAVLEFQNPRAVFNQINTMVKDRHVRFIELETWSDDHAFMLVKNPNWEALAREELVVVKAEETATSHECPECSSRVGERWATCIACNAALGA